MVEQLQSYPSVFVTSNGGVSLTPELEDATPETRTASVACECGCSLYYMYLVVVTMHALYCCMNVST